MNSIEIRLEKDVEGQIVHIPMEMALSGETATVRRDGLKLIIEEQAGARKTLLEVLSELPELDEDFPEIKDFQPEPVDL